MKKIYIVIMFIVAASFTFAQQNVSKTGTTAATFLEIPSGGRAIGMGGAAVSTINDASALYWNPSAITNLEQSQFLVSHTNWIAQTNFDFAALVINLGTFGSLGLSYTSLSMPDMQVTTVEKPDGTGEYFSAGDMAIGLTYARTITDRFSIGITAKFIQQKIWHESAYGFGFDAGTTFRTDLLNGLVIGATISNFGSSMQMTGRDTRAFYRVDATKLGSNEKIPYSIETDSWDLPLYIQLGISTNVIKTDDFKWLVAVDALHPNNNYESVNVGSELSYKNVLFLRGGYQSLFLKESEGGLSLGLGVTTSDIFGSTSVVFDYAYRDFGRLESVHVFTVGIKF
ncbi:MAG: PorV/PorQ family protein [Bacteroidota bacterium]|nr:PorV/PorQ family protein [Bacteroidota bacterium]